MNRILFLEDEPHLHSVLRRLARRQGWEVVSVESPSAAREVLEHVPEIDLILSDYALGQETSREFLSWARRTYPEIPCVLTSGTFVPEVEARVDELYDLFLPKPFTAGQLRDAILSASEQTSSIRRRPRMSALNPKR